MKKVLVVEDEVSFLKILDCKLTKGGYKVTRAINGKEGFKKAIKGKPDLILLDIKMPIMDGMTMLDLLRQDEVGKKIKVIILTNIEPNDKIIKSVIKDKPLCFLIKSDTKLNDLIKKIKVICPVEKIVS